MSNEVFSGIFVWKSRCHRKRQEAGGCYTRSAPKPPTESADCWQWKRPLMVAITVVLAAKAVRKVRRISRPVEGVSMAHLHEPANGVRVRFGGLKRIALQIGTAFA